MGMDSLRDAFRPIDAEASYFVVLLTQWLMNKKKSLDQTHKCQETHNICPGASRSRNHLESFIFEYPCRVAIFHKTNQLRAPTRSACIPLVAPYLQFLPYFSSNPPQLRLQPAKQTQNKQTTSLSSLIPPPSYPPLQQPLLHPRTTPPKTHHSPPPQQCYSPTISTSQSPKPPSTTRPRQSRSSRCRPPPTPCPRPRRRCCRCRRAAATSRPCSAAPPARCAACAPSWT